MTRAARMQAAVRAGGNRRKNAIGTVRQPPAPDAIAYDNIIGAIERNLRNLPAKQKRQLLAELAADIEQREADLDRAEEASTCSTP